MASNGIYTYSRAKASAKGPFISRSAILKAFNQTRKSTSQIIADAGFVGYMEQVHPRHAELCRVLIVEALRKQGTDLQKYHEGQGLYMQRPARGAPENHWESYIVLLSAAEWITIKPTDITRTKYAGDRLVEIWEGKYNGNHIYDKGNGRKLAEKFYSIDSSNAAFHSLMKDFLQCIINKYSFDDTDNTDKTDDTDNTENTKLRVKEIGADISEKYVLQAREKFARTTYNKFMDFKATDVERPPEPCVAGTEDIVIAVNVIRETSDIVQSLKNIRRHLRKEGGIVLLLEATELDCCWTDFLFGFTESWWSRTDKREQALQCEVEWQKAFFEAGFDIVGQTIGNRGGSGFQTLFMASTHPKDAAKSPKA
ncbi:polyketide synthase [Colletotrichum asianum]|uniref:Polyketide synthase n=1 Tax=Colletotrichum asianum TaxID=702518 RepID=A0A8H3WIK0_9PEZI|nr:polyketide synthase [Colletotrichum asianum]